MHPWIQNPPQAAVFDMDGTLLNSGVFGVKAIRDAFEELIASSLLPGMDSPPDDAHIRAQIGKPPYRFYQDLLPETARHMAMELHRATTRHELQAMRDGTAELFEGTVQVLETLKRAGLSLLMVSNCNESYMHAVNETFGLLRLWDYTACVGDAPGRTKSGLVAEGLKRVSRRRGVMVGDRIYDGEAAQANGLWFIGCPYGYGSSEEFAQAHACIASIRELPALLGVAQEALP